MLHADRVARDTRLRGHALLFVVGALDEHLVFVSVDAPHNAAVAGIRSSVHDDRVAAEDLPLAEGVHGTAADDAAGGAEEHGGGPRVRGGGIKGRGGRRLVLSTVRKRLGLGSFESCCAVVSPWAFWASFHPVSGLNGSAF